MDKLFAEVTDLFKQKSLARGVDEKAVDSVLNLMSKFVGCAFNSGDAGSGGGGGGYFGGGEGGGDAGGFGGGGGSGYINLNPL